MDGSAFDAAKIESRMHLQDLRSTLAWLKDRGELAETDKEVDPDLEVTGLQKLMDGGCPVIFNNVKAKPTHRVLTNLFGDRLGTGGRDDSKPADEVHIVCGDLWE